MIRETAPAKINIYLHVGSVRDDGLHDLASLFVFTETGDEIIAAPAEGLSLEVIGPFAPELNELAPQSNLVFKAAAALQSVYGVKDGAALTLVKNLPIASGIGGGSADAAAALRALVALWRVDISDEALAALAFGLGADVPACLTRAPVNVTGAGELVTPGPALPPLWACLVNPGVDMPTGPIFKAFDSAHPAPPAPALVDGGEISALMARSRNDLEPMAIAIAPEISAVLEMLAAAPGNMGARMSGSGATCFGLFATAAVAGAAQEAASKRGWWAMASKLASG